MSDKKKTRRVVPKLDEAAWDVPTPERPSTTPAVAETVKREVESSKAQTKAVKPQEEEFRGRGRPPNEPTEPDAELVNTTIRVYDLDLEYLDDQVRAIRRGGGPRSTTRSEVLRGILRALRSAGITLGTATSEDDVEALVRQQLR